jgi:hypothetical protein
VASIITSKRCALALLAAVAAGPACSGPHVSPLAPPPYRAQVDARYDVTWTALVRAFAQQNLPLRAIARDSGVIASDDVITPIGLWADCGRIDDDLIEGDAIVSFTVFAEATDSTTRLQINSKMRTQAARKGSSGKLRPLPVYQCASTGRFEANLLDTVHELVKN